MSAVNGKAEENGIGAYERNIDTEYRFLNAVANLLKGDITNPQPNIYGKIKIASHLPYCPSCQRAILTFHLMFPNINIEFSNGTEGNKKPIDQDKKDK